MLLEAVELAAYQLAFSLNCMQLENFLLVLSGLNI